MNVIAKMQTASVEDYGTSKKLKLTAIHDNNINTGSNAENKSFTRATPWGECVMTIDNPYAVEQFRLPQGAPDYKQGSQHYVIFVNADEHTLDDVHRALGALDNK
jgi:hypothetical protein